MFVTDRISCGMPVEYIDQDFPNKGSSQQLNSDATWVESFPPAGHDVYLPASLQGNYRLLLRNLSCPSKPTEWTFQYLNKVPCGCHQPAEGYTYAPPYQIERVISYKEPVYLPSFGPAPISVPKESPPAAGVPVQLQEVCKSEARKGNQLLETKSGPGWKVFHCSGSNATARTIICLENILIQILPHVSVQIEQTNPEEWFKLSTHQNATCLKEANSVFAQCHVAYTSQAPCTHILAGKYSIHINEPVSLKITHESPSFTVTTG